MRQLAASVAVLASLLATACLHKDTSSTIWLKGDGSLEWIVIEHNVGSDLEGAGRQEEERQYLEDAANAASGAAESFRALGAQAVRGRLLRDVRPVRLGHRGGLRQPDGRCRAGAGGVRDPLRRRPDLGGGHDDLAPVAGGRRRWRRPAGR